MIAMTVIDATSFGRRPHASIRVLQHLVFAAVTLTLGFAGHIESPVVLIVMIAALCVTQLIVSLGRTASTPQLAHATPHMTMALLHESETSSLD